MRKLSSGFLTSSDTNLAIQAQKMARGVKFQIKEKEELYSGCSKTKALIICMVTPQLNCAFVFAYAKSRFSHDFAHC